MFSDLRTNITIGEHGHADLHNEERTRLNRLAMADNEVFYVDRYDSVQAAVTAAVNAGGGVVQLGRGEYDINEIVTDRASAVTFAGQGMSIHGPATKLRVTDGARGIVIQNTVGGHQAVHVENLLIEGGAVGIHVAPSVTQTLNARWQNVICRAQSDAGFWLENAFYDCLFENCQAKGCATGWRIDGLGLGHNANTWLQCGAQDCVTYGVHTIGSGGQGGNSSWIGGIVQANRSIGWYMDRPQQWLVASVHWEYNGILDGAPDLYVDGHGGAIYDLHFLNVIAANGSPAQKENPPAIWLDANGHLERCTITGMTNIGSKAIRENGVLVFNTVRHREVNFVWGETHYINNGIIFHNEDGTKWLMRVANGAPVITQAS